MIGAYTLLIDQEQVKLEKIRNTLRCFASHLWITKDSRGHIWPFSNCHGCEKADFCRKLKLEIERGMN